jgi:CxxC motif-containing protein
MGSSQQASEEEPMKTAKPVRKGKKLEAKKLEKKTTLYTPVRNG